MAYVPARMNLRFLASTFIALAGVHLALAQTDTPPPNPPPAAAGGQGDEDHTELGDHMEKVGKAFKQLRRQVSDASQNDSSLALVAKMRTELSAASLLKPAKEADLPPDQQADFQAKFQDGMKEFLGQLDKLSDMLKAGDNAGATEQVKKLGGLERQDHKQFRKPKKD